jgi:hypothetical protein
MLHVRARAQVTVTSRPDSAGGGKSGGGGATSLLDLLALGGLLGFSLMKELHRIPQRLQDAPDEGNADEGPG